MTIDRTALRQLYALTLTANGDEYWDAMFKCRTSIPPLLDELDASDRRIAELELFRACVVDSAAASSTTAQHARIADLELRLSIATESNVNDRKRIAELEAGLREAIDLVESSYEDQRTSSEPLACPYTIDLRKLLSSEET